MEYPWAAKTMLVVFAEAQCRFGFCRPDDAVWRDRVLEFIYRQVLFAYPGPMRPSHIPNVKVALVAQNKRAAAKAVFSGGSVEDGAIGIAGEGNAVPADCKPGEYFIPDVFMLFKSGIIHIE